MDSDKVKELKASFDEYDINGDGNVTAKELVAIFKKLGVPMDKAEIVEMIKEADINGDKMLNWEEFKKYSGYWSFTFLNFTINSSSTPRLPWVDCSNRFIGSNAIKFPLNKKTFLELAGICYLNIFKLFIAMAHSSAPKHFDFHHKLKDPRLQ